MPSNLADIMDPNRGFRVWEIREIYTGQNTGYVPNVDDIIYDVNNRLMFKVTNVDYTTGLSEKIIWTPAQQVIGADSEDIFIGGGPGAITESFRCYLDTSVLPYRLAFDSRLHMYTANASYVKVFLGRDITNSGTVVSAYYDQNQILVGENIPLEVVTIPNLNNVAIKAPKVGYCNRIINDGEGVTVVVYDTQAGFVSSAYMLIKNTHFVRDQSAPTKYIVGISLLSPFISDTDDRVLEYPVNATVSSNHLMGVVHYSDATTSTYPVDGTRFTLDGLGDFVSTQAGQRVPMVLRYSMLEGETTYLPDVSANNIISKTYTLTSTVVDGAYSVKLFAYPRWLDEPRGYAMDYWLYSMNRDQVFYVTPYINQAVNSAEFQPTLYATQQNFTVTINISEVNPNFEPYIHVQQISVTLSRRGNLVETPNWTIGFTPNQTPRYGVSAVAKMHMLAANSWTLDMTCGYVSKEEWLRNVYYHTLPLFNPHSEIEAPLPTHMELRTKNYSAELLIDQWSDVLIIPNDLAQGELLELRFFRRQSSGDLQLGLSCLPVHIV